MEIPALPRNLLSWESHLYRHRPMKSRQKQIFAVDDSWLLLAKAGSPQYYFLCTPQNFCSNLRGHPPEPPDEIRAWYLAAAFSNPHLECSLPEIEIAGTLLIGQGSFPLQSADNNPEKNRRRLPDVQQPTNFRRCEIQ